MAELWKRKARLRFGERGQLGKEITGLDVDFSINKNTGSEPNKASITVYNLNEDSRGLLSSQAEMFVSLEVAYGNEDYHLIFSGDIIRAPSIKKGSDWNTMIEAGDGQKDLTRSTFSKSYTKGTSTKTIFNDIVNSFQYTEVIGYAQVKGRALDGKMTIDGNLSQALDKILLREGLVWTVQDEILRIMTPYEVLDTQVVSLSKESGLIDSPFSQEVTLPNFEKGKGNIKVSGIKFKSLIIPNILPTRAVEAISKYTNGVFKCVKAQYNGSTYGNEWYITVDAIPFGNGV